MIPASLYAATEWVWTERAENLQPSESPLTYHFHGPAKFEVPTTADGSVWVVNLPSAQTRLLQPGKYTVVLVATVDGEARVIGRKNTHVLASPVEGSAVDYRTEPERLLEGVREVLQGRAAGVSDSLTIEGTSIKRMPIQDLRKWEASLSYQVNRSKGRPLQNYKIRWSR